MSSNQQPPKWKNRPLDDRARRVETFFYTVVSKNTLQTVQVQLSPCKIDFNVLTIFPRSKERCVWDMGQADFFCDWTKTVAVTLVTMVLYFWCDKFENDEFECHKFI